MIDLVLGYMTIGLVNGSFYALLSLGLALIFGLLNVLNMTHGALYMMGAFAAWAATRYLGAGYLTGLLLAPLTVGAFGILIERTVLRRTYSVDPLYGFMLTFGLATVIQGLFQVRFGSTGLPYSAPDWLSGGIDLGFLFLPTYRLWVVAVAIIVCAIVWTVITRTRAGSILRASSENAAAAGALGVQVPLVLTLTFGLGAALAGLAGALAAPVYQVSPLMGSDILLVVFAIIVIGGMGSIGGTILASFALALIESFTQALVPQAGNLVIFILMCLILLLRPQGLFGIAAVRQHEFHGARLPGSVGTASETPRAGTGQWAPVAGFAILAALIALPALVYPIYLMQIFCFAILAASFNFLLGFAGIISFGHAALFGTAAYLTAHGAKVWALPPELAILLGTVSAALLGLVMGALAIRRRGIYQAMITLAVAQMAYFVYVQASFTHSEDGIHSVPRGLLFGWLDLRRDLNVYVVVAVALLAVFLGLRRVLASEFGTILVAIRDNERRALSLGYNVSRFKLAAFVLSASIAGLAGALSAIVFQLATLSGVHWHLSGQTVLMALIGGIGTFSGPLFGAAIVITMQHFLSPLGAWVLIAQGAVFVICVLAFRDGLAAHLRWPVLLGFLRKIGYSLRPTP
jgi:branched-chain amino acid transport system permease protein